MGNTGTSLLSRIGDFLQHRRPWFKLPRILAFPRLIEIRNELRRSNLHDTEHPPLPEAAGPVEDNVLQSRTYDGTWNDLKCPHMGATGRRFGRNVPLAETFPDIPNLMKPSPRQVSLALMTRHTFQPATILNLLAASWIQFMVHDWFVHKRSDTDQHIIPLAPGDTFPGGVMKVPASVPDGPTVEGRPPAYANENSHWWDGSGIYGSDAKAAARIRSFFQGKLRVSTEGRIPLDADTGNENTGFTDNGWIGLSMLHGLFALEHNYLCDVLRHHHPDATDQWLYDKARLINSALMAKIHTVEWTCAIIPHPTIQIAMNTNWNGVSGEFQEVFKFLDDSELLGGIVGSHADHHSAPYSLTEEFVSVYRMHALMPDDYTIRSAADDKVLAQLELPAISGARRAQGPRSALLYGPLLLFRQDAPRSHPHAQLSTAPSESAPGQR